MNYTNTENTPISRNYQIVAFWRTNQNLLEHNSFAIHLTFVVVQTTLKEERPSKDLGCSFSKDRIFHPIFQAIPIFQQIPYFKRSDFSRDSIFQDVIHFKRSDFSIHYFKRYCNDLNYITLPHYIAEQPSVPYPLYCWSTKLLLKIETKYKINLSDGWIKGYVT